MCRTNKYTPEVNRKHRLVKNQTINKIYACKMQINLSQITTNNRYLLTKLPIIIINNRRMRSRRRLETVSCGIRI